MARKIRIEYAGAACHVMARRRWVSERLRVGDESRVTQAIGRVKRDGQPELARLKGRLERVCDNINRTLEARRYSEFPDGPFYFSFI